MSWAKVGATFTVQQDQPIQFRLAWRFGVIAAGIPFGYRSSGPTDAALREYLLVHAGIEVTSISRDLAQSGMSTGATITGVNIYPMSVSEIRGNVLSGWIEANATQEWVYQGSEPEVYDFAVSETSTGTADTSGREPEPGGLADQIRDALGLNAAESWGPGWSTAATVLGVALIGFVGWRLFREVKEIAT